MIFQPHTEKQDLVLFSPKPIVVAATGIQWGKTMSGVMWLKMLMHQFTDRLDNFLITSPNYKIFSQSTLPPFLKVMDGLGRYNKQDQCFELYHGGKCWFRTGDKNPDSVVGITNVRGILCDEAGLYGLYFWENIQGRASFKEAPIRIVTSPYALNWLYKDYIRPIQKNNQAVKEECELIQASSKENPYFPNSEYERKRKTMDPRRFLMMYGGEFIKATGLVYEVFDEQENMCDPFLIPSKARIFGGIDWGFTDPFVLKTRMVLPNGYQYDVAEVCRRNLTVSQIKDIVAKYHQLYRYERIWADPSRPEYIQELSMMGIPVVAADNRIRIGIDRHYELLKSRKLKVFRDTCKYTVDEYDQYHYPEYEEPSPNKNMKDQLPVDQNNHCMDAERYISIKVFNINSQTESVIILNDNDHNSDKTIEEQINTLISGSSFDNYEEF